MRRCFAAASKNIAAISTISYIRAWVCLNPVLAHHLSQFGISANDIAAKTAAGHLLDLLI